MSTRLPKLLLPAALSLALPLAASAEEEGPLALPGFNEGDAAWNLLLAEPPPVDDLFAEARRELDPPPSSPSENAVINLINALVAKGVLTRAEAQGMIEQAERDALMVRESAEAVAMVMADQQMQGDDDLVVSYVPEPVKARLREEIRLDLLEDARAGNWGTMRDPDHWSERFSFSADVRVRYRAAFFPEGNDGTGAFPNFNTINRGAPFDIAGTEFSPQYNVTEDRDDFTLRARAGFEVELPENFFGGMRIATGNNDSPVSTNQIMSGDFNKYQLWLDRAWVAWEPISEPAAEDGSGGATLRLTAGRFENPFFKSSEMMWDNDLNFDGFAFQLKSQVARGFTPFLNAGAFPIFNTDFNFSTNSPEKFASTDKWLYAGQFGFDWRAESKLGGRLGVGLFEFKGVQGELSDPFLPLTPRDAGNTDGTRPSFAQRGNTYRAIRNIIPDPLNGFGTMDQYQYFGLASEYQVLNFAGKIDIDYFEPARITLYGEYAKNLNHDPEAINAVAVNNRGPIPEGGAFGAYEGGDDAWILGVTVGKPALENRGDWQLGFSYRHVEADALVDAFTDSNFGLGGTNFEGYVVRGVVALSPNVNFGVRWMSATEIVGPPLRNDLLLLDLNANF